MADKDLLMAYSVMDKLYMNGLVKQIRARVTPPEEAAEEEK
jgi:hypothetical protein